jgi:YesN/AraC family two-component response regulator
LEKYFDVHWAPTGRAGRALLGGLATDIVVLEYQLPDCSGLDLIKQIRCEHEALPIVMVTRHGSEHVCASAFRIGVGDYLSKPVEESELVATVRRLVQERRMTRSPASVSAPALSHAMPTEARLEWIARHILDRYSEPLSVGELAHRAGMSRSALSRGFNARFCVSIRTYIAQVRITHAMQLLARACMSVTEIAQDVGFYDLPRFDKVFQRLLGMSPSAYRRSLRTAQNGKFVEQIATSRIHRQPF